MISTVLVIILLTILVLATIFVLLYCTNAKPLSINTFDGSESPYHPSVVYVPDGWNGWRYWMVETPFSRLSKPYVDRNECPSIHVSNDGINWAEPKGLNNPLINLDEDQVRNLDYYSDPHLVLKPDGVMECWFRYTQRYGTLNHRSDVALMVSSSKDGISWSEPVVIKQLTGNDIFEGNAIVSPALIYDNNNYRMWCVDSESPSCKSRNVRLYAFNIGTVPEHVAVCSFDKPINPWHIDVQKIKNELWMVIYDYYKLTLWRSNDGLAWNFVKDLLYPSRRIGSFFSDGLYRAALTQCDNDCVFLYFSASDINKTYIGLMKGDSPKSLALDKRIFGLRFTKYIKIVYYQILLKLRFLITHLKYKHSH